MTVSVLRTIRKKLRSMLSALIANLTLISENHLEYRQVGPMKIARSDREHTISKVA